MSKIVLDQTLRSKLNGLNEPMEVCDESGTTLGHFLPSAQYQKLLYRVAEAACPHTAGFFNSLSAAQMNQVIQVFG